MASAVGRKRKENEKRKRKEKKPTDVLGTKGFSTVRHYQPVLKFPFNTECFGRY